MADGVQIRKISFEKAEAKMRALGAVLHRPLRDVLDSGARVAAISCARSAVPYGTGADAFQLGRSAVARDIMKVYATPGQAYADIADKRYAGAFWTRYQNGEYDRAQEILAQYGNRLAGVPLREFDDGSAHKSARDARSGRVRASRPVMVVVNPKPLDRYIAKRQDNVGFGKGGFADIARALGKSPRGLRDEGDITANWITRKGQGYGKAVHGGSDEQPEIVITNSVPYADQILPPSAKSEALRIARERMLENLRIAVEAETRKLRSAA